MKSFKQYILEDSKITWDYALDISGDEFDKLEKKFKLDFDFATDGSYDVKIKGNSNEIKKFMKHQGFSQSEIKDELNEAATIEIKLDLVDDGFDDEKDMIKWFKSQKLKIKYTGGPNGIEFSVKGKRENIMDYMISYYDPDTTEEELVDMYPELG